MTASLVPPPKTRFFNAAGTAPLVGGKVYTYAAGTTTPKTTFTDYNAGTPNANPVILDANGEANIWYNGNYKIVLKDANDVQQWSVDNVASTVQATVNYAGGTVTGTGDALVIASVTPTDFTLISGVSVSFVPNSDNTGAAATLNVVATGVKNLYWVSNGAFVSPPANLLKTGVPAQAIYDGTEWVISSTATNSPPFVDSTAIIRGSADSTKLLRFEVDGFTAATTRVLTPPNFDGTIATLAGSETLTNKTFRAANMAITDVSDATKVMQFSCSSITTGTTRTLTVPDNSGTVALTTDIFIKAWCKFNGTTAGTNAPTSGFNVTSVTRNGTGDYTVTFTNALSDVNYAVAANCRRNNATAADIGVSRDNTATYNPAAGSFRFRTYCSAAAAFEDPLEVHIIFHR